MSWKRWLSFKKKNVMNETENAATTVPLTVWTMDESMPLIRSMSNNGRICSEMASISEKSLSRIANTRSMKRSSESNGSRNESTICGMSSDENSSILRKTMGTNSQKTPTTATQIVSSVQRAASQRGSFVFPTCSPPNRSVSGLPTIASTAETST